MDNISGQLKELMKPSIIKAADTFERELEKESLSQNDAHSLANLSVAFGALSMNIETFTEQVEALEDSLKVYGE